MTSLTLSDGDDEMTSVDLRHRAAVTIQRCYRAHIHRRHTRVVKSCRLEDEATENKQSAGASCQTNKESSAHWSRHGKSEEDLTSVRKEKVDRIMRMLQEAETQNARTLAAVQTAVTFSTKSTTDTASYDHVESVLQNFRKKITDLKQEISDKDASHQKLVQEMEHREQLHKMEMQNAIQMERARYEQQQRIHDLDLEKRLKFIDSLLQDKDKWVKQSEKLADDLRILKEKHASQIQSLKEKLVAELRKQKQEWNQKETAKREKWIEEQKEQILESTAKAMEPKIADLVNQHKTEVRRLMEKINRQEKVLEENEEQATRLRQRLIQDREDCIEKERLRSHSQLIHEKERWVIESEAEKDGIRNQWMDEKSRRTRELEKERIRSENAIHSEKIACERRIRQLRVDYETEQEALRVVHGKEIDEIRRSCEADCNKWRETLRQGLEKETEDRLSQVKQRLERERDEEIEVVMKRFEDERDELESELRKRIVQSQHDKDRQIEISNEKSVIISKQASELVQAREDAVDQEARAEKQLAEKDEEIAEYKRMYTEQQKEIEKAKLENVDCERTHEVAIEEQRQKFESLLRKEKASTESFIKEIEESRQEIHELKRKHQEELENLEEHVKESLEIKDALVLSLQQKLSSKTAEVDAMNRLLTEQNQCLE